MSSDDYAGLLGFTSRGVIAIHADWPNYPLEHGPQIVLTSLGIFPFGSSFRIIDDIDYCALLLASDYVADRNDLYSTRNLHVALWDEDLLEAVDHGWLEGLEYAEGDECEYDGGDFDAPRREQLMVSEGATVRLTMTGVRRLEEMWSDELEIPSIVQQRVVPLIELQQYDTAVREIGVLIESRMRALLENDTGLYGVRLGEAFINKLVESGKFLPAGLKMLRGEIRTTLKFVRNHFAHNTVELAKVQALALISRTCHLLGEIDGLTTAFEHSTEG